MPDFDSAGLRLHYSLAGPESGDPIVLVHGFASTYQLNWVLSRWEKALTDEGWLVVGLDCRGHGQSDKPHNPAAYERGEMAADVTRLLRHLGISRADYLGFSMGSWIGLKLLLDEPGLIGRAVLGGIGRLATFRPSQAIADRFRGDESISDPVVDTFHRFAASQPHNDLLALAACIEAPQPRPDPERLATITTPILIVTGDQDDIAPHPEELAAMLGNAEVAIIEGRTHHNITPSRAFKERGLEFLSRT